MPASSSQHSLTDSVQASSSRRILCFLEDFRGVPLNSHWISGLGRAVTRQANLASKDSTWREGGRLRLLLMVETSCKFFDPLITIDSRSQRIKEVKLVQILIFTVFFQIPIRNTEIPNTDLLCSLMFRNKRMLFILT